MSVMFLPVHFGSYYTLGTAVTFFKHDKAQKIATHLKWQSELVPSILQCAPYILSSSVSGSCATVLYSL